jgi:hypothetical protein
MASLPGIGSFYLWEQHAKCHRDARIRRHFPHWFGAVRELRNDRAKSR